MATWILYAGLRNCNIFPLFDNETGATIVMVECLLSTLALMVFDLTQYYGITPKRLSVFGALTLMTLAKNIWMESLVFWSWKSRWMGMAIRIDALANIYLIQFGSPPMQLGGKIFSSMQEHCLM